MGEPRDKELCIEYINELNDHMDTVLELKGRENLPHFLVVKYSVPHKTL